LKICSEKPSDRIITGMQSLNISVVLDSLARVVRLFNEVYLQSTPILLKVMSRQRKLQLR